MSREEISLPFAFLSGLMGGGSLLGFKCCNLVSLSESDLLRFYFVILFNSLMKFAEKILALIPSENSSNNSFSGRSSGRRAIFPSGNQDNLISSLPDSFIRSFSKRLWPTATLANSCAYLVSLIRNYFSFFWEFYWGGQYRAEIRLKVGSYFVKSRIYLSIPPSR